MRGCVLVFSCHLLRTGEPSLSPKASTATIHSIALFSPHHLHLLTCRLPINYWRSNLNIFLLKLLPERALLMTFSKKTQSKLICGWAAAAPILLLAAYDTIYSSFKLLQPKGTLFFLFFSFCFLFTCYLAELYSVVEWDWHASFVVMRIALLFFRWSFFFILW